MRFALLALALCLVACDGAPGLPSGPSDTHRGEADAVDPARNVILSCEKDKNGNNISVVTTITNNCNKNNPVTNTSGSTQ